MFSMMPVREFGLFEPLSLNWVMFAISSNEHGNDLFWYLDYITVKSLAYWWSLLILKLFPEFCLQIHSLQSQQILVTVGYVCAGVSKSSTLWVFWFHLSFLPRPPVHWAVNFYHPPQSVYFLFWLCKQTCAHIIFMCSHAFWGMHTWALEAICKSACVGKPFCMW